MSNLIRDGEKLQKGTLQYYLLLQLYLLLSRSIISRARIRTKMKERNTWERTWRQNRRYARIVRFGGMQRRAIARARLSGATKTRRVAHALSGRCTWSNLIERSSELKSNTKVRARSVNVSILCSNDLAEPRRRVEERDSRSLGEEKKKERLARGRICLEFSRRRGGGRGPFS